MYQQRTEHGTARHGTYPSSLAVEVRKKRADCESDSDDDAGPTTSSSAAGDTAARRRLRSRRVDDLTSASPIATRRLRGPRDQQPSPQNQPLFRPFPRRCWPPDSLGRVSETTRFVRRLGQSLSVVLRTRRGAATADMRLVDDRCIHSDEQVYRRAAGRGRAAVRWVATARILAQRTCHRGQYPGETAASCGVEHRAKSTR